MSSFSSFSAPASVAYEPTASEALGKDVWVLTAPFSYYVGKKEDNIWVDVYAGYMTDGATVPRLLWSLIPPWGSYGQAAVLHDYLCDFQEVLNNGQLRPVTRKEIDAIFDEAMQVLKVPNHTRRTIMAGVNALRLSREALAWVKAPFGFLRPGKMV